MKLLLLLLIPVTLVLLTVSRLFALAIPPLYGVVATAFAVTHNHSWVNEVPNTLRVVLVSAGCVAVSFLSTVSILVGVPLIVLGVLVNDEAVRRVYRQKGVIVLSGIDATGKSTHARNIQRWVQASGGTCVVRHFDRYLFLSAFSSLKRQQASGDGRVVANTSRLSPLRPYLALLDNLLFYVVYVLPHVALGRVVVCDRFIWDNAVKHAALGYPTRFLFTLATLIRPRVGVVFDVPAAVAFRRVAQRGTHLQYTTGQYERERTAFRRIATRCGYLVIDTRDEVVADTFSRVQRYLASQDVYTPIPINIGLAIPCHVRDTRLLGVCLAGVRRLRPLPAMVVVGFNRGGVSMKRVREALFERVFAAGCDVVVSCDVDFYLHAGFLRRVRADKVQSYAQWEGNVGDVQQVLVRLVWPRCWSGLYSVPRRWWPVIRRRWDGSDGSVCALVGGQYRFVRSLCYRALRPRNTFSIVNAIRKRMTR